MTNQRHLVSRNKREGWYRGYLHGHNRYKHKWACLQGKPSDFFFFTKWMESIGLGGRYE